MNIARLSFTIVCFCCSLFPGLTFPWNSVGHRIIAQIAYDQLKPNTIRFFNRYNRAVNQVYPSQNWMAAATWLDTIRHQNINTYNAMHYINLFFTEEGIPIPPTPTLNAVTAIEQSIQTITQSNATPYQKGIAFRILLHVVGDIHQPLHATSRVSQRYPEGDRGGHFVELSKNPVASNLHAYWDNGGGYLKCFPKHQRHHNRRKKPHAPTAFGVTATWEKSAHPQYPKHCNLKQMARQIEQEYPCNTLPLTTNPSQWAAESHEMGLRSYQWLYHNIPDHAYQAETIKVAKKRIALAGCRLGWLLNHISG